MNIEDGVNSENLIPSKNSNRNRRNKNYKRNKKLRKLLANENPDSASEPIPEQEISEIQVSPAIEIKKAKLVKFVITKDKAVVQNSNEQIAAIATPESKASQPIAASPKFEKKELLVTRTAVVIGNNKIVLEKRVKQNFDEENKKSLPKLNIRQVIKSKVALSTPYNAEETKQRKVALEAILNEIAKEGKSKLKIKVTQGKRSEPDIPTELPIDDASKFAKKKKKNKKNPVNKYEAEALASKDEVIELPPEDYIKMTFPEDPNAKIDNEEFLSNRTIQFTEIPVNRKINIDDENNIFANDMIDHVKKVLIDEHFAMQGSRILLAVSGGVDSIVMLDIIAQLAEEMKYTVSVAHFNHKLRGLSSDSDEELVKKVCTAYNIKCYTGSENIMKFASENAISIEQAARTRRYKMFERLSGNLKIDFVSTAHSSDDSVETFFLNLFRGTGLTGLAGIPRQRHLVKNTYMIRPLIDFKKENIYKYAKLRNLQWREDETNALTNYTRNKVRLELLPKIQQDFSPAIFDLINRTSKLIRGADEFITGFVNNAVEDLVKDRRKDQFHINIAQLETHSEFIQSEIIQSAIVSIFKLLPPNLKVLDRILALSKSPSGAIANINKQVFALRDREKIIFAQSSPLDSIDMIIERISENNLDAGKFRLSVVDRKSVEFSKDPFVEYLDADLIPAFMNLRNWEIGDEFKPLGMDGTMKISDFLTNQKISTIDKRSVLVLATKTDIIWVVGKRLSNIYKVTGTTSNVIKAEFILKKENKGK